MSSLIVVHPLQVTYIYIYINAFGCAMDIYEQYDI